MGTSRWKVTGVGIQDVKCRERLKFLREEALCLVEKLEPDITWDDIGYWMALGKWERPGLKN